MASVAAVVRTISFLLTPNCCASVSNKNTTTKKSNASRLHPRNPARTAWCEAFAVLTGVAVEGVLAISATVSLLCTSLSKEKPRAVGVDDPGWGYCDRGGPRGNR